MKFSEQHDLVYPMLGEMSHQLNKLKFNTDAVKKTNIIAVRCFSGTLTPEIQVIICSIFPIFQNHQNGPVLY